MVNTYNEKAYRYTAMLIMIHNPILPQTINGVYINHINPTPPNSRDTFAVAFKIRTYRYFSGHIKLRHTSKGKVPNYS